MGQSLEKDKIGLPSDLRDEVTVVLQTRRTLALVTAVAVLALSALTGPEAVQSAQAPVECDRPVTITRVASVAP
jgi:hypothetical protein